MARNLLVATIMGDCGDAPSRRIRLVCRKDGERYSWFEEETGADCEVSARTLQEAKIACAQAWGDPATWDLKASWL